MSLKGVQNVAHVLMPSGSETSSSQTPASQWPVHTNKPFYHTTFVHSLLWAGQTSSLLWTSAIRPRSGPGCEPSERRGIGRRVLVYA